MFEISLTATQETADEVLQAFIASVPQFDVKETRTRSSNNYGKCYIYLQLTPNGSASAANKGGRPPKLSAEQIADIRARLRSDQDCNKSQLAREYGVTYGTILKISKAEV